MTATNGIPAPRSNTIAARIVASKTAQGFEFVGMTSGWYSFKPTSNLGRFLAERGLTPDQVEVECGARKQRRTEGTQLLVFRVPAQTR